MAETFHCDDCGRDKPVKRQGGTGYADYDGARVCYACCAARDREQMTRDGRAVLYLTGPNQPNGTPPATVSNWPGTLRLPVHSVRRGRHNMARVRYDVRFRGPDGAWWVGTQYGDNTQLCHCRRVKS